jgi:hypothetical protein
VKASRRMRTPWRPWLRAWLGAAVPDIANVGARRAVYERRVGDGWRGSQAPGLVLAGVTDLGPRTVRAQATCRRWTSGPTRA